jgi:hypothetical protein
MNAAPARGPTPICRLPAQSPRFSRRRPSGCEGCRRGRVIAPATFSGHPASMQLRKEARRCCALFSSFSVASLARNPFSVHTADTYNFVALEPPPRTRALLGPHQRAEGHAYRRRRPRPPCRYSLVAQPGRLETASAHACVTGTAPAGGGPYVSAAPARPPCRYSLVAQPGERDCACRRAA